MTSDAPDSLTRAHGTACPHCTEANATHLSHPSSLYQESHAGRLLHTDIAEPFVSTRDGRYRYTLVIVDDHTRFKHVSFLAKKSEAMTAVKRFTTTFNAYASVGKETPVRIVGALHSDNAGEFLSHEFKEFLDEEGIAHTTCPPHVHSLNGVAERAIRSIMEVVRSNHAASGAPVSF